ncbi:MAG: acyltransferase family protein [Aerococcus sp.]|nr:acyltransferase family protein [Aerococcus sp.]
MKRKYYGQLDAIRLIAMLAIICYHYFKHTITGGFLGVDLFLLMSGILLTSHLEQDYLSGRKVNWLIRFFKRISKLFWPMLAVILICLSVLVLFKLDLLTNLRSGVWSSLLFVANWQQILSGGSYFANFLHPSIVTHLWYLAVYAQLMLLVELFYAYCRRFFKNSRQTGLFFLGLSIVSAIIMALLFSPGQDPTRVYYGTDTRFFSFGLGAAAVLLLHPIPRLIRKRKRHLGSALREEKTPEMPMERGKMQRVTGAFQFLNHWVIDLLGVVTLGISGVLMFVLTDSSPLTYYGGIFLFNTLSAIGLVAIMQKKSWLGRLLNFKPLVWLGQRTYPMFLWYYPIYVLLYASLDSKSWIATHAPLQIGLIFILGILTHELLIERRLQIPLFIRPKGEPLRLFEGVRQLKDKATPTAGKIGFWICMAITFMGMVAFAIAPVDSQAKAEESAAKEQQAQNQEANAKRASENAALEKTQASAEKKDEKPTLSDEGKAYYQGLDEASAQYVQGFKDEELAVAYQLPITFVGDSILVGTSDAVYSLFPHAIVSAHVGMQMYEATGVVQSLASQNQLYSNVVLELGANGPFTDAQFNQLLDAIGSDKHVYVINTHVDRQWHDQVNQALLAKAKNNDKLTLIDWDTFYKENDHTTWMEPDGLHLNKEGAKHWMAFIGQQIIANS